MKIALILLAVILLLLVGVVAIGALLPKRHVVSRSASYRAAPDQLFSLIAGDQKWRPDVRDCKTNQDDRGWVIQRETTSNGQTITYEIRDIRRPTSLTRRIATEGLPYSGTWSYSLQPEGAGTVVRITEDGQVYNPVFRFVSRFVLGHTSTMDAYLRALGKAVGQEVEVRD